jgi:multidrug efflux system membrane fusion protein
VEVAPREIEYVFDAPGSIEAAEEISIPASVSGIIDAVNFKEGDAVDEKTVLVEIEVDRYRLGEERAKADLDRAQAQSELAETLLNNRVKLYEEGKKQNKEWVTEEQMATWRADARKAKADVERARVDLELARRNHRDARVRSPIRGLINRKLVSRGEFVKAETVVATILNVGTLHVRFTVPELEASRLSPGREIQFTVKSAPAVTFTAKVFYMNQKADPVTRTVECKALVPERSEALRAGYFAQVKVVTEKQRGLAVPERAISHTERGFVLYVVTPGKDGPVARARPVKLGLRLDGEVEITEGLKEGEKVVVDGALTLRDGAAVDVVAAPPEVLGR